MAPRHRADTLRLLLPRRLYSIVFPSCFGCWWLLSFVRVHDGICGHACIPQAVCGDPALCCAAVDDQQGLAGWHAVCFVLVRCGSCRVWRFGMMQGTENTIAERQLFLYG